MSMVVRTMSSPSISKPRFWAAWTTNTAPRPSRPAHPDGRLVRDGSGGPESHREEPLAAHLHNSRCSWVRTLGREHGVAVPPRGSPDCSRAGSPVRPRPKQPRHRCPLQLGCNHGGRIPSSKDSRGAIWPDVAHVLTYFVAHEARASSGPGDHGGPATELPVLDHRERRAVGLAHSGATEYRKPIVNGDEPQDQEQAGRSMASRHRGDRAAGRFQEVGLGQRGPRSRDMPPAVAASETVELSDPAVPERQPHHDGFGTARRTRTVAAIAAGGAIRRGR